LSPATSPAAAAADAAAPPPALRDATREWLRIGCLSFGGPAAQIALMHRILVDDKRWVDEPRFLNALNFCMLLPGPEAQQLAVYLGWLLNGSKGGLIAGSLFVLPGAIVMMALSIIYALYSQVPLIDGLFYGISCAVLAIVVEALLRIGRRALKHRGLYLIAAAAFVLIFFFAVPFPLIVLGAGLIGWIGALVAPQVFAAAPVAVTPAASPARSGVAHHLRRLLLVLLIGGSLWWLPTAGLAVLLGVSHTYTDIALFFSKMAVVTFGGAYAVLAYVAQQAVEVYGWLQPQEMLTGLGLAETTPGPLIMVVQFVGFLAGFRAPEPLGPLAGGVSGGLLATWVTFVPSFLWIFLGAPYIERLRGIRRLSGALTAITAAVVGVILNLAVWFALHVLFARIDERPFGPVRLLLPDPASIDPFALVLAAGSMLALLRFHAGLLPTLAGCALAGIAARLLF
jgi:chromate transporter